MLRFGNRLTIIVITFCLTASTSSRGDMVTLFVVSSAITKDVVEYVARIGKPQRIHVKKGQRFSDILRARCGRLNNNFINLLRTSSATELGKLLNLDFAYERDQFIELPACLSLPQYTATERIVEEDDSPWDYFSNDSAGFMYFETPSPMVKRIVATAADAPTTFMDAFGHLNPGFTSSGIIHEGEVVQVPKTPAVWSSLQIRPDIAAFLEPVSDVLARLLMEGGQTRETALIERPEEIILYAPLTNAQLVEFKSCQASQTSTNLDYAFDPMELTKVITVNKRFLQEERRSTPDRTTIVIPDTGLYTHGRTPFHNGRLILVDRYSPSDPYASIRPSSKYPYRHHGTYVASVALGGASFLQAFDVMGVDIKIAPINIIEEKERICWRSNAAAYSCPYHRVKTEAFNNAMASAETHNAILNLSVGRLTRFIGLEKYLNKDSSILFVVAAGNAGQSLSKRKTYPSRYGGSNNDGKYNLISVAALDLDGSRAGFSNYGSEYVDIAAPGCRQRVFEYNDESRSFSFQRKSGTSFAAPLVSFTAALIKSFWLGASPRKIKHRIITASDISEELWGKGEVAGGRMLNVVKAVSLYQDIVEARADGESRLIRGEIDSNHRIFEFCDGRLTLYRKDNPGRPQIKKITPIADPTSQEPRILVYWTNVEGVLRPEICAQQEITIKITEDFTGRVYELPTDSIIDVVFSERLN